MGIEADNMWFSIGENAAVRGFKWYGGTANIMTLGGTGNLTCAGAITCSDLTAKNSVVSDTVNIGGANDSVVSRVRNLGTGYASSFFNAGGEEAQLWIGGGFGFNLRTNTATAITFQTGGFSTVASLQILGTGTRDVQIIAPLRVNGTLSTFNNNVTIGATKLLADTALTVTAGARIDGNLSVGGNLTVSGTTSFANPYWVAVVINFVGGVPTIIRNGGRNAATSLIRVSAQPTGIIQFDFPEHPQGVNYIISVNVSAGYGTVMTSIRTSTRCGISMRNTSNALFDTEAHVLILAY
jgi:hypothetical protein